MAEPKHDPTGDAWFDAEPVSSDDSGPARKTELTQRLVKVVEELVASPVEKARRQKMLSDMALYDGEMGNNAATVGLFAGPVIADDVDKDGMAFNLCFGKVQTIRNRICAFRPRGQFLPQSGDRKAEQGAEDKTTLCDAWMQEQGYYRLAALATRDRLILPSGWMKYSRVGQGEHERTTAARVPPWEVIMDPMEWLNGAGDTIYHVYLLKVSQAAREYDLDAVTLKADAINPAVYEVAGAAFGEPVVAVIDAYKRGPEGRHTLLVGSTVAVDEAWEHDSMPLEAEVYDESPTGYGVDGKSCVRVLRPLQEEVNEWELDMREAHHLNSQAVHIIDEADPDPQVNNQRVRVQRTKTGSRPPEVINPAAVNAEMYNYFKTMEEHADKLIGLSPFSQSGQGKPNVISKVAMREESELQTDRLALESQKNEHMAIRATYWWWQLTRDICRENPKANPKWRAIDRGAWKEMVFSDLDAEYEITVFPTSLFGTGVSGQLDKAGDLIDRGWLSREDAMRAVHAPDLSPIIELSLSEPNAMQEIVDRILENGDYTTPDPYLCDPLKLNQYAAARYRIAWSKKLDYPKANLTKLRTLIKQTAPKKVAGDLAAQAAQVNGPVAPTTAVPGVAAPPAPTTAPGALVVPPGASGATAPGAPSPSIAAPAA